MVFLQTLKEQANKCQSCVLTHFEFVHPGLLISRTSCNIANCQQVAGIKVLQLLQLNEHQKLDILSLSDMFEQHKH